MGRRIRNKQSTNITQNGQKQNVDFAYRTDSVPRSYSLAIVKEHNRVDFELLSLAIAAEGLDQLMVRPHTENYPIPIL